MPQIIIFPIKDDTNVEQLRNLLESLAGYYGGQVTLRATFQAETDDPQIAAVLAAIAGEPKAEKAPDPEEPKKRGRRGPGRRKAVRLEPLPEDLQPSDPWTVEGTNQVIPADQLNTELASGRLPIGKRLVHAKRGLHEVMVRTPRKGDPYYVLVPVQANGGVAKPLTSLRAAGG